MIKKVRGKIQGDLMVWTGEIDVKRDGFVRFKRFVLGHIPLDVELVGANDGFQGLGFRRITCSGFAGDVQVRLEIVDRKRAETKDIDDRVKMEVTSSNPMMYLYKVFGTEELSILIFNEIVERLRNVRSLDDITDILKRIAEEWKKR